MTQHLVYAGEYRDAQHAAELWRQHKNTQQIGIELRPPHAESWVWNRIELIKRLAHALPKE